MGVSQKWRSTCLGKARLWTHIHFGEHTCELQTMVLGQGTNCKEVEVCTNGHIGKFTGTLSF